MINYRYNETKYALKLLENGFITKYHVYELKILAKFFKAKGFKPKQRKELIYEFCQKYIEGFNQVLYFRAINSVLNYAVKKENKLIDIDRISVSRSEIDYIIGAELTLNEKKVLFTLLTMNKINKQISNTMFGKESSHNKFGGSRTQFRELYKAAKINGKSNINEIIHDLYKKNHLNIETGYRKDNGKVQLSFIDKIERDDQVAIIINTYDNIGYYFDQFIGDSKVINCKCCGTLIHITSNRKKYCVDCFSKIRETQNRNKSLRYYYKNKS
ncbi:hypothetical protein G7L40_19890 [Paenibacillus polymyxa]|uniref:Uncharacterized protein n=1 Tax=Paenibacillus polymyxa TaxID=1406 RepID=A0A378Y1D8_PAEPO|nr:hypothetical protein [Paenibacillus polymyxa]MBE7896248.1 hypothetical protein [Paenibacillus polymyxa]MBG9765829.1 hypothetical protein [Paenibacillus polymyxa]MCC3256776.1 hypothetical protein [Paenibacillus polymyxa]QPK54736.1 hypothetical protein G7035_19935 [Paenibacillus polymyxa]QPK59827.1 hypothetical protein G7L40_19890 [Paenibacillus polymyxa]